ncbi:MAG TPA: hypothetical protein VGR35_23770 [Tepidisphaeraceae bacterium]|nr:hypothetical protein [Tepidisphaeraceae bacterium]
MASTQPEIVVHLVHGTWAPRTAWARRDSRLCRRLREEFGPRMQVRRVIWSGRNQHSARLEAAEHEHLERHLGKVPDVRHFVIAHSHGGNVALLAAHRLEEPERLAGIATLATPFITFRRFGSVWRLRVREVLAYVFLLGCVAAVARAIHTGFALGYLSHTLVFAPFFGYLVGGACARA